jgi:hypothetical protein
MELTEGEFKHKVLSAGSALSLYEVEFDDGVTEAFAASKIAECVYPKVDQEGNEYSLIDEIVDHEQ